MKKSFIVAGICFALSTVFASGIDEAFANGKAWGEIKSFYINRSYDFSYKDDYKRDALAIGGTLNYKTAPLNGFDFGVTFYSANKLDNKSDVANENDTTLLGKNGENYTVLGQTYIGYKSGKTSIKVGRQSINTPFAAPNNFRLLPNTFEGAVYNNKSFKDMSLELAHITKIQVNGFANSVPTGGNLDSTSPFTKLGLLYGFGTGYQIGEFTSLDKVVLGQNSTKTTKGMTYLSLNYCGYKNFGITAWDFYLHDIMNIFTTRVSYKNTINSVKNTTMGFYTKQSDIGDNLLAKAMGDKDIDSTQFGFLNKSKWSSGVGLNLAYTKTGKSDSSVLDGGIINPFGGANTYIISQGALHSNFGDTNSYMVGLDYSFKPRVGKNLLAMVKYFQYDVGKSNGYLSGHSWTTKEIDLDFIYKYSKQLTLRARASYPREWFEKTDGKKLSFDEYRLIAYYRF